MRTINNPSLADYIRKNWGNKAHFMESGPMETDVLDSTLSDYVSRLPAQFQRLPELAGMSVVTLDLETGEVGAFTAEEMNAGPVDDDPRPRREYTYQTGVRGHDGSIVHHPGDVVPQVLVHGAWRDEELV